VPLFITVKASAMCATPNGPVEVVLWISIVRSDVDVVKGDEVEACSGATIPAMSTMNSTETNSLVFNLSSTPLSSAL